MMRFSFDQIFHDAGSTFRRFPAPLCAALIGTVAAILLVDHEGSPQPSLLFPLLFAALLGIPLFISISLAAEVRKWNAPLTWGCLALGLLLLVGYGFLIPPDFMNAPGIHLARFFLLAAVLCLAVAVVPFFERGGLNGFWQYNKTLFIRILTALLYTHVLWIGCSIALSALDHLFGISIPGKRYPEMWIALNGIFCSWFFLAGIPGDPRALEAATEFPKALKVFTQYILFPLVLVYLVILYAYMLKIVISWEWPIGWVSGLILGFAGIGIFSLLLLYPISSRDDQRWLKIASRWFYPALAPLAVMLILAVGRRVSDYGWTEGRSLIAAIGGWLVCLSAYFIISKTRSIKFVPVTLAILLLGAGFGPWSIFSVSERSQTARLESYLVKDSILVSGVIRPHHSPVSREDAKQISSVIAYLHDNHGYDAIARWFAQPLMEDSSGRASLLAPAAVAARMGVEYTAGWRVGAEGDVVINADQEAPYDIHEYAFLVRGLRFPSIVKEKKFAAQGLSMRASAQLDTVSLVFAQGENILDTLRFDMRQLVHRAISDSSLTDLKKIPPEYLTAKAEGRRWKMKAVVCQAFVSRRGGTEKIEWFEADVFYALLGN